MKYSILILIMSSSLITACGGGSGDTSTATTASIQGKAIDGYITGATVYLDYNFNNKLDAGEPSATTGEDGDYNLALSGQYADCADYAPLVLDVPVGATDSDFGEITEAYQMVTPPVFATTTSETLRHISPLSTIVWTSIEAELKAGDIATFTTCDDVKSSYAVREAIQTRVTEQEWRFANRYGITVEEMYGDYVESGNTALHAQAQALVPGLTKSYDETIALEQTYPTASYAYIEYFYGRYDETDNEFDDKWYREEYVGYTTSWTKTIDEYNSALNTNLGLVYKEVGQDETTNNINYEFRREFEGGLCSVNEFIRQEADNSPTYGVRNLASAATADYTECEAMDLGSNIYARYLLTNDGQGESSEHMYRNNPLVGYDNLIGLETTYANIDYNELTAINFISTDFDDTGMYGADWYVRNRHSETATTSAITTRDSDSIWSRYTLNNNGITTTECSVDGNSWTTANNTSECYP